MRRFEWIALLVVVAGATASGSEPAPKPVGDLELRISAWRIRIRPEERPEITVTIRNRAKNPVVLVEPGLGSSDGLRTPIIDWSVVGGTPISTPKLVRCGNERWNVGPLNVGPLEAAEVFVLGPGESRQLGALVGDPPFPAVPGPKGSTVVSSPGSKTFRKIPRIAPGEYRMTFTYENAPARDWGGKHDAEAMARVRRSTPCRLVSNELTFVVDERAPFDLTDEERKRLRSRLGAENAGCTLLPSEQARFACYDRISDWLSGLSEYAFLKTIVPSSSGDIRHVPLPEYIDWCLSPATPAKEWIPCAHGEAGEHLHVDARFGRAVRADPAKIEAFCASYRRRYGDDPGNDPPVGMDLAWEVCSK